MTQAIQKAQPAGLTLDMVSEMTGFDLAELALIRHKMATSAGQEASLRDIALFSRASKQLGLDPLLNQVHWISRGGKGVLQVGIDGFRAIADRSGVYAGSEVPSYRGYITQEYRDKDGSGASVDVPEKASVVVWKVVAGHKCAFTGEARWTEFYPGNKEGFMWRRMPHHMLGKAAEAQALRKAFPAQLGTIVYADDGAVDGEYPDAGREQSWEQQAPQIVEQPRPRPSYQQVFGSEETGTAYDLPENQTRAAPVPPEAAAQPGRGESDSPTDSPRRPAADETVVSRKDHPLWKEWLEIERRARVAELPNDPLEGVSVHLPIGESELREYIALLNAAIDNAATARPEALA